MENNIIYSFDKSIKTDCKDILVDSLDATLDKFLEQGILETIPFFKVIKTICNGFLGIRELHLMKNTAVFIQELNNHNCNKKKIEKYSNKILKSPKRFEKELERILIILDKETEREKSQCLGRLFCALINKIIDIETFADYTELIQRIYWSDIKVIRAYWNKLDQDGLIPVNKNDVRNFNRISSHGVGELVFINSSEKINKCYDKNCEIFGFDNYSQKFLCLIFDLTYTCNKEIKFNNNEKTFFKEISLETDENGNKTWTL